MGGKDEFYIQVSSLACHRHYGRRDKTARALLLTRQEAVRESKKRSEDHLPVHTALPPSFTIHHVSAVPAHHPARNAVPLGLHS